MKIENNRSGEIELDLVFKVGKKIAMRYLEDPVLVTDVRGMLRIYRNI